MPPRLERSPGDDRELTRAAVARQVDRGPWRFTEFVDDGIGNDADDVDWGRGGVSDDHMCAERIAT